MTRNWEPGVQYNFGDSVEYMGNRYNIIQPHRSQGDWAPDVVPALWGRVPHADRDGDFKEQYKQSYDDQNQNPASQWNTQPPLPQKHPDQGGYYQAPQPIQAPYQTSNIDTEEQKKSWYDSSDEHRKQPTVGGGLAAHGWLEEAQERTQRYYQQGPTSPVTWILVQGKQIPQNAIVGGQEGNNTLYIARAHHEGGVQVGKASPSFSKGAIVGFKRKEIDYDTYEVLVGDQRAIRWVDVHGKLNLDDLHGCRPIEGGKEANGDPLYISQGTYKGETICGKATITRDAALIPADDSEHDVKDYKILCYVSS